MTLCPNCYQSIEQPGTCPTCRTLVPPEWFSRITLSLAVTGARAVGKSIMIGVMIDQFETFLQLRHGSFLNALGNTKQRFDEKYRKALYENRRLLEPTPPAKDERLEPLLWSFEYEGKPFCLSILDAAGEDFEKLAPTDNRFRYLGFSDLIVSLIDPLKVPGVAAVLEGVVSVADDSGQDLSVLRAVLEARNAHRGQGGPDQVLAIVLSKFDVLQRLRDLPVAPWQSIMNRPGSTLQRDPSMVNPTSDFEDQQLLGQELQGLLLELGAGMLLTAAHQSQIPYRLFASSALGAEPDKETVSHGGISPFRVLDVLQAGLARKGAQF